MSTIKARNMRAALAAQKVARTKVVEGEWWQAKFNTGAVQRPRKIASVDVSNPIAVGVEWEGGSNGRPTSLKTLLQMYRPCTQQEVSAALEARAIAGPKNIGESLEIPIPNDSLAMLYDHQELRQAMKEALVDVLTNGTGGVLREIVVEGCRQAIAENLERRRSTRVPTFPPQAAGKI